jgi:CRISPR/Cas system-associated exonuclease Cas4 (RecB family)
VKKDFVVTASELGEYVYCKRAWWLRINGYTKENSRMVEGTNYHNNLANRLDSFELYLKLVLGLIGISILLITLLIIFSNFNH